MTADLHTDAVRTLTAWVPHNQDQDVVRRQALDHLAAEPDAAWRTTASGHLTASAVIVDRARGQVLLSLHRRFRIWVHLGGHCEPGDTTLAGVALREATEESGIDGLALDPEPLGVDVHPITCGSGMAIRHLDTCFLAVAPPGAVERVSDESLALGWFSPDALPSPLLPTTARLVPVALDRLHRSDTKRQSRHNGER